MQWLPHTSLSTRQILVKHFCKCNHFEICYEVMLLLLQRSVLPFVEHYSHHSSFIIYFEETFMNTCQLHACCSLKLRHHSFQLHANLCYFRINYGAAI